MPCVQPVVPATTIAPGDNWQTKATAAPINTQFRVLTGTHTNATVIPKTGQQFLCDPGAIMDGGGVTQRAFWGGNSAFPNNVVLRGCRVTNYAPPNLQSAAVQGTIDDETTGGSGWIIDNVEIDHSSVTGLRLGTGMLVRSCYIHDNTTFGVSGPGTGIVFDRNTVSSNGTTNNAESAGSKFVLTVNARITNNLFQDNNGPGIWLDIANDGYLVENNTSLNNYSEGIVIEIGYAGIIRNNVVRYSGMRSSRSSGFVWNAGIGIHASHGSSTSNRIEVYGNLLEGNAQGITLLEQPRGSSFPGEPPQVDPVMIVSHVTIHDNVVHLQAVPGSLIGSSLSATVGADENTGGMFDKTARDISIDNNTYTLNGKAAPWAWNGGFRNTTYWTGTVGFDTHSSITP